MKARINVFAAVVAVVLALSSFAPFATAAKNKSTISKKELKVLLRTAKEPAEHRKIAEYYRQEAQRLTASSKEHAELAAIYQKHPPFPAVQAKQGTSVEGTPHCKRWAELDAEQAKEAEALAAMHEDMAKAAEQKQ